MPFCKYCGSEHDVDAVFCTECGKPVGKKYVNEAETTELLLVFGWYVIRYHRIKHKTT